MISGGIPPRIRQRPVPWLEGPAAGDLLTVLLRFLVEEVPGPGEVHGDPRGIGRSDDFLVTD